MLRILNKLSYESIRVRHNQQVQLIAVSKARSVSEIQQAVDAGQMQFGENYVQESLDKIEAFEGKKSDLAFYWPNTVQQKLQVLRKNLIGFTVLKDSRLRKRLSDQRHPKLGQLKVLLQINIDREKTKSGFFLEDIVEIVPEIKKLANISLRGFMCIPNPGNSADSFTKMSKLLSKYPDLDTLSMGMSADLELAIEKGATFVRIGTDIFGEREYN